MSTTTRANQPIGLLLALLFSSRCVIAAPTTFDIPPGPANRSITRLAQQAGIPILFQFELVKNRQLRRLKGRYDVDAALELLLRDSGLVAQRDNNNQIVVFLKRTAPIPAEIKPLVNAAREDDIVEEVRITGTRIERNGMSTPTPVSIISHDELRVLNPTSLVDALVRLPQFLNNDTPLTQSFGTSGAAGASYLNLRGIGSIRTLVLLNGQRIVPATRSGTIDIASLPWSLIDRVEVVTGGASAAYGSDAVSGVVNLLLDTNFHGLNVTLQGGSTARGDNENGTFSFAWGDSLGDHSQFVISAELYRALGIKGYKSREWFGSWAAIRNPDPTGPARVIAPNVHSTAYTYGGLITSGPLAGTQFLQGGNTAPFRAGSYVSSLTQSGGDGIDPASDLVWLLPDQTRANAYLRFTSQLSDSLRAFVQVLPSYSESVFEFGPPALWGAWEATIYNDNAFLPGTIRTQMTNLGLDSFRLGRISDGDLGQGQVRNRNDLLSITAGLDSHFAGLRLDGYYQYGHNRNSLDYRNTMRLDRVYRGIDSVLDPTTGNIVCRSTLRFPNDGCVPINLFGQNSVSIAARNYVTEGRFLQVQDVDEHVVEARLQGTLLTLPAGDLSFAVGSGWRNEAVVNSPRRYPTELEGLTVEPSDTQGYRGLPAVYSGQANIFERTSINTVSGNYSVTELFGEAATPIASEHALAKSLTLLSAVRVAHYSGSGNIAAWKAGIDWTLSDQLRFRLTRSRDIRAGSLSERFDVSTTGVNISDPFITDRPTYTAVSVRTGNPDVDPEKADALTLGLVAHFDSIAELSLSADYFDIRIHDAIATVGVQRTIDNCYAGDTRACERIERNATAGLIRRVTNLVSNTAEARSRGLDLEASWRGRINFLGGSESMAARIFANYAFESSTIDSNGTRVDRASQTGIFGGAPSWQVNASVSYRRDGLQVTWQQQLISRGHYNNTFGPADIDNNSVASAAYSNLLVSWQPESQTGISLFAHVSNLFDKAPARVPDWGFVGSIPSNESLFDVLGRRYAVGLSFKL
jgi:iron complex outermembrane recepter protein